MLAIRDRNTIKEVLELPDGWTPEIAKTNFRRLIKLYHPDVNKTPEASEYSRKLIKAYNIVSGKEKPQGAPPKPYYQGEPIIIVRYGSGFGNSGSGTTGGFGGFGWGF